MPRADDSDIDDLLAGKVALPPKPAPAHAKARHVTKPKLAIAPEAVADFVDRVHRVAEISEQLAGELARNTTPPAPKRTWDEVLAAHLSSTGGPAQLLDVEPEEYHQLPGLSSSCAKTLLTQSPLHAYTEHPWLGATRIDDPTEEMDRGAIVHKLVLGRGAAFEVLEFKDWRTKDAQAARAAARSAGKIPVLEHRFAIAEEIAQAIRDQLGRRGIELDGDSEVPIEWWESVGDLGFVRCRGMFDHAWLSGGGILDLKITGDASPPAIERNAENMGYALQSAAYTRAITALQPSLAGRVEFQFCFVETTKPYAMSLVRPDGEFRALGDARWWRAVGWWARCLAARSWPGYEACRHIGVPSWALKKEGLLP